MAGFRLAAMFVRVSAADFEDDRYSYPERQRRLAVKEASIYRRFWRWFREVSIPAKILVSAWIVTAASFCLLFGALLGLIIRIKVAGL